MTDEETPMQEWDGAVRGVVDVALVGARVVFPVAPTRALIRTHLLRLARSLRDPDDEDAAARLLERIAGGPPELRDLVLEAGAVALVRQAREGL